MTFPSDGRVPAPATSADDDAPEAHADAAAAAAGVRIEALSDAASTRRAADLLGRIWQLPPPQAPISAEFLRALSHTGNYVAGAFDDEELVGVAVGMRGVLDEGACLHSQITGVVRHRQGRSVGFALKLHQRWWALERGLPAITWTFDPLVRRNAYFNLVKLGARPIEFLHDFYGPMTDGYNAGDESDRLLVRWTLTDGVARVEGNGSTSTPDATPYLVAGTHGEPVLLDGRSDRVSLAVPVDIHALRREDPDTALLWRRAFRRALEGCTARGLVIVAFDSGGRYILQQS